ncbi:MAG: acyl-CoA dehydrogenase family protein [Phenylobacterium sp.]
MESLEDFRQRARTWIRANLRPLAEVPREEQLRTDRASNSALQAKIYDAGFAGYGVPTEYGGSGLTLEHQQVWSDEQDGYERPGGFMVSIGMMMPTVLDHGTEEVKKRHIPRMLRGDEHWLQLLSEPSGGSDMAGVLTRATRKGDAYLINGSKMWSSGANVSDYGLCLARINWDAPKHQGLGMFIIDLKAKGVDIKPIRPVNGGEAHFCLEYFDDVEVPDEYVLGHEGMGWTVAQRLLFHERNATAGMAYGIGLGGGTRSSSGGGGGGWRVPIPELARKFKSVDHPVLAGKIAEDYVDTVVAEQLQGRINVGMGNGKLQGHWGSLPKLSMGIDSPLNAELGLAVGGADSIVWSGNEAGGELGLNWLRVRTISIAGGSNEIQRNIVSERLLNLPREPGPDKNAPFSALVKQPKADAS